MIDTALGAAFGLAILLAVYGIGIWYVAGSVRRQVDRAAGGDPDNRP